jgi:hypothetical protein
VNPWDYSLLKALVAGRTIILALGCEDAGIDSKLPLVNLLNP